MSCFPGCVCEEGLILNERDGICVPEDSCLVVEPTPPGPPAPEPKPPITLPGQASG